jgi:hypothetical protein
MLRYTSGAVLHGSNIREALMAASAILVAEGYPPITVVSGDREYDEQVAIFLARYVLVGQVNGRRVYDFRWWEGRQYARISPAGTVAAPSRTAPHVAKIAADLGYPYNDRNTAAHRRLQQIAPGLGLDWTGRFFGEDWHWETTRGVGRIDGGGTTASTSEEEELMSVLDDIRDMFNATNQAIEQRTQAQHDVTRAFLLDQTQRQHDVTRGYLADLTQAQHDVTRGYLVDTITAAVAKTSPGVDPGVVRDAVESAVRDIEVEANVDIDAIAKRVNDEADKRARQRLNQPAAS